jgi:hypothetical protein
MSHLAIVFVLVYLSWLMIEDVVKIGVFGYVCSEFGDTFATALRRLVVMKVTVMWVWMMRRFQGKTSGCIPELPITPTIINTMAKSSLKK